MSILRLNIQRFHALFIFNELNLTPLKIELSVMHILNITPSIINSNGETAAAAPESPPLHDLTTTNAAISLGSPCIETISPVPPQEGSTFLLMAEGEAMYLEKKRKLELQVLEMNLQANTAKRDYYKRKMELLEKRNPD